MNNHQRGIYQPLMDNIPVYDLSEEEVEEEERSRLPLLIVIALVVLAAFAGVVWLAYNQGVARGRASAALVINAPQGPVRTAPADAGGAETPYTGLQVYRQPVPPDQEAQASALAPAPAPVVLPAPAPAETVAKPSSAPRAATAEAPPLRLNSDSGANAARQPAPAAAANSAPAQVAAPKAAPVPAAPAPAAKAPPAPAREETASAAPSRAAAAGGAVLQIGAYESENLANGAWARFKARHADVTANLSQDIQKADLGAKGTWYRLRIGPFVDKSAAVAACEKLRAEGGTCFVAAP